MSDPATISILPEGRGGTLELQKAISAHSTCLKCKSAASPITSRCGGGRRKRQYFQSVSMEMHRAAVSKVNSKHTGVTQVHCSLLVSRNDCTTGRVSLSHRERTAAECVLPRRRRGSRRGGGTHKRGLQASRQGRPRSRSASDSKCVRQDTSSRQTYSLPSGAGVSFLPSCLLGY